MNENPNRKQDAAEPKRVIDPLRPSALWRVLRIFARFLVVAVFDLKVHGRRNVPARGGVLLVSNHQSYLDPVLLGVFLQRPMSYLAKSELFENRHFAWLIRSLHAVPVKQGAGDVGAVKEMIRRLREGHILNIYPEGSRTNDGQIAPLLPGAALVVKKAGVPIVPVVMEGSFDAWPKRSRFPRPFPIDVMYGPPLDVSDLGAREIIETLETTMRAMFDRLREMRQRSGRANRPGAGGVVADAVRAIPATK